MPELHAGDSLAIMSTGAYGFVMASNYNSRRVSAEALVRGRKVELFRRQQTLEPPINDEIEPVF
jgi:diaminopimelate decarboxylase